MQRFRFVFLLVLLGAAVLIAVPGALAEEAVRVEVFAYVDINGDKLMNAGEGIDNVPVFVDVDGQRQVKVMDGGKVTFSLPYANVEIVKVEIPYLAVGEEIRPKDNVAEVSFRFNAPELPVYLP